MSSSPGLLLLINGAFTKGQIGYSPSVSYDTSSGDTNLFNSLQGQVSWEATPRLRLTASDVLTQNDDPVLADVLGLRRERQIFTSNSFSLNSNYRIANIGTQEFYRLATFFPQEGPGTISQTIGANASTAIYQTNTVSFGYDYLLSETEGSDTAGHRVTASMSRQLSAFASAGVTGSYALRTVTRDSGAKTDVNTRSISLFNSYAVPGKWSLNGSIGLTQLESDPGRVISVISTVTNFSYQFFVVGSLTFNVDQGFSETFAEGENFGIVETKGVRGSYSYPLTPFINGTANAFYRQSEFTGIGGGQSDQIQDTWGGSLSFSIKLLRWLNMGLDVSHTERTSSTREGGSVENRARVSLNAAY